MASIAMWKIKRSEGEVVEPYIASNQGTNMHPFTQRNFRRLRRSTGGGRGWKARGLGWTGSKRSGGSGDHRLNGLVESGQSTPESRKADGFHMFSPWRSWGLPVIFNSMEWFKGKCPLAPWSSWENTDADSGFDSPDSTNPFIIAQHGDGEIKTRRTLDFCPFSVPTL